MLLPLCVPLGPREWSAQHKRMSSHLSSSCAARKRQHHGCPPSQTSARAKAERLSLWLHGDCRHPSMRNASKITGRGLAGLVRRKLIGNVGDGQPRQGRRGSCGQDVPATCHTKVSRSRQEYRKVSAVAVSTAALTLCPQHYQAGWLLSK